MAKSASSKKTSSKQEKSPSAFADKSPKGVSPSTSNPSRIAPTKEIELTASGGSEDGVQKLFISCIKDIYWAENELIRALPKMARAAQSEELREALLNHLEQTKGHAQRLEGIFQMFDEKVQAKKCDAMEGLLKEGEAAVESTLPGTSARDLAIILSSQKVEHYEMSSYKGLIRLSSMLGLNDVSDVFNETLTEEIESDEILSNIAENDIPDEADQ